MNKKLIALAVAAAIAPAAAMADSGNVTIYGVANMSVDNVSANGGAGAATTNVPGHGRVSSNNSHLGFKGSEDLGNGLSAIWQIEQTIGMDGTAAGFNTRNTYLGLSSKTMGTALIGQHDTPYKLATGKLDIFADTLADYNSIIGTTGFNMTTGATVAASAQFDRRTGNTAAYITPTVNGLHGAIGYVFGENPTLEPLAAATTQKQAKAWSLAGIYDNGPIFASLAWEKHDNLDDMGLRAGVTTPGNAEDTATGLKLGLGYKFNTTKVGFVWEKLKGDVSGSGVVAGDVTEYERNAWNLNLAHQMGANTFKIAYARADKGSCSVSGGFTCDAAGTKAHQWTVGVDHAMSKRTNVYALWTQINNDYDSTTASGNMYNFGANPVAGATAGADPRALSLGVRHSF